MQTDGTISNESQLRHEAERGRMAHELMENPLLVEAFDTIRERIETEWKNTKPEQRDLREQYWLQSRLLSAVADHLRQVMETGKLASLQMEQSRSRIQKAKEWIAELI